LKEEDPQQQGRRVKTETRISVQSQLIPLFFEGGKEWRGKGDPLRERRKYRKLAEIGREKVKTTFQ